MATADGSEAAANRASTCSEMMPAMQDLFTNPAYSDLTIYCGSREWKVNKCVICSQSTYFAKVANGAFKEASCGTVRLEEDNELAVHAMIEYFYTRNYSAPTGDDKMSAMSLDVLVFHLADKYMLSETLKHVACKNYATHAALNWSTAAFVKSIIQEFDIAGGCDTEIMAAAFHVAKDHALELLGDPDAYQDFRWLLNYLPKLNTELAKHTAALALSSRKGFVHVKCPSDECYTDYYGPITFTLNATAGDSAFASCPFCEYRVMVSEWKSMHVVSNKKR